VRADNSHHLVAAARRRALDTRDRAVRTLRRMDAAGRPVTMDTVAREAGVSRSWLYSQPDLRAAIQRLRGHDQPGSTSPVIPARQHASDASLRRRLEVVNAEIRRLRQENQQLREQLAVALGERRAAGIHKPIGQGNASKPTRSTTIGPCS
jgi:Family of unknown function (DUF6262)